RSRASLEAGTDDCTAGYSVASTLPSGDVPLTAVDTGARKELVTAMSDKEIHRFSMPILLTAPS
ncbi:MAG TPA: hypothetical protein VK117_14790, partial [Pyrinomonadaceae bacterium]|nr:hypothetical protein [Pyrinomonadaceae bacterium]